MMLVKILEFGSNWWARFAVIRTTVTVHETCGHFNSTGVRCGSKMRRYWIVPGLSGSTASEIFNPQFPNRAVGRC